MEREGSAPAAAEGAGGEPIGTPAERDGPAESGGGMGARGAPGTAKAGARGARIPGRAAFAAPGVRSRSTSSCRRASSPASSRSRSERRFSTCAVSNTVQTDSAAMSDGQNGIWNCKYAPMKTAAVTSTMAPFTMRSAMPLSFGIPPSLFSMLAMEE